MPTQILDVYLHGNKIGKLSYQNGELSFVYDADYLGSEKPAKLSHVFPLNPEPFDNQTTEPFFSGLLPDDIVRRRLARYLGVSEGNTFALLREVGGECAGAVSVFVEGESPAAFNEPEYKILDESDAKEILSSLDRHPFLAGEEGVRLSGAGAQDKLIVSIVDGKLAIPLRNTPSTHIIKPPIKDLEDTVFNEFFCMKLAGDMGLPVPEVDVYWLGDQPYYLVKRYDRRVDKNESVRRLHQEDFCQALQIPPEQKYENEGGPSLQSCFDLLEERIAGGNMAGKNRLTFLQGVIFNYLVGNGDAHGKNFSLLYDQEVESLAPFYDLMNTLVYGDAFKAKMAMKIASKYKFREVGQRHFDTFSEENGFRPDYVQKQLNEQKSVIKDKAESLADLLNQDDKTKSSIYKKIIETFNV